MPDFSVEAPDEEVFDITKADTVEAIVGRSRPDVVINCAAYNQVDDGERDPRIAFLVNAEGVKHLAEACRETGSFLVHFGTDYVFNGEKGAPYTEEDAPDPINNYGRSKLAGEEILKETLGRFLLFRVSWVFGEGQQNFLHKMLQVAENNEELKVVNDQISIPTSTRDIVTYTMAALKKDLTGMYHLTPSGYASRYEVIDYFFSKRGMAKKLIPVPTDYFPSPAGRPRFSALSNEKLAGDLGVEMPGWKEGVEWYAAASSHPTMDKERRT